MSDVPANPAVLSRLYLHAVLPCLTALVDHDRVARDIVGAERAAIVFRIWGGPAVTVRLSRGAITHERRAAPDPTVVLLFFGDRHLNAFFAGNTWAVPLPIWGGWRLKLLARFTRLTDRLGAVLNGHAEVLATPEGRALHARLSLIMAGLSLSPLAMGDEPARQALSHAPVGLASFTIEGTENATVWFDHGSSNCDAGWGPPPRRPDVAISFADSATAYGALREEIDTLAAVGTGQIKITGLIPLADGVNLVMERLSVYLHT
ncbi:MAG: hypothetical protein ACHQIL_08095 [Steroidobacterales bacterium]